MARPIDFTPAFGPTDAVGAPTDPPDERIEVGVLIVGGGPGGLACAIRLGQLLEEHPDVRERLGDVPVAVLEKGKQPGSHLLSGAVMAPRALRDLFRGRLTMADVPTYGEVPGEAVYMLTRRSAIRIPAPPTMRNHGNVIVSVSELGRFLGEQAEALGVTVLPESAATKLLVHEGRVVGVRTGDRGRGRQGEPLPNFEPGSDLVAGVTVLAEGTQGILTAAAIERFGLQRREPADLGARREGGLAGAAPAAADHPHDGLAAPGLRRATASSAARSSTRWATTTSRSASSPGSRRATSSSPSTTSCRSSRRTGSSGRSCAAASGSHGARRRSPRAGTYSLPTRFNAPGLLLVGEGPGLVNVPRLKGIHYAIESGRLAAEAAFRALQRGEVPSRVGALDSYDEALRSQLDVEGAVRGAEHAPGIRQGILRRRRSREHDDRLEGANARQAAVRRRRTRPHR